MRSRAMTSELEQVEFTRKILDQFKEVELLAEEVQKERNNVLGLSQQKDLARQGWRALKNRSNEKNVWYNIG